MLRVATSSLAVLFCCFAALSCGDDKSGGPRVDGGDGAGGVGGGADASTDMDATVGDAKDCSSDDDCDDGAFCNGLELCMPGAGAGDDGCVRGQPPCDDDQVCDEGADACMATCDVALDGDGDGHTAVQCGGDDCDDADPDRFPGNPEICDPEGHDEDCDGSTYGDRDTDGDGFVDARCCNDVDGGDPVCGDDCDDFNRTRNPGETEVCDELDNDCNGQVDEGVRDDGFADMDGDLHGDPGQPIAQACAGKAGFSLLDDDCDDTDPTVHGAQAEICDGLDNDCDMLADEEAAPTTWYADVDADGFGDAGGETQESCSPLPGFSLLSTDCDDDNAAIQPAAAELCDGVDNNCDGRIDDGVTVPGFDDTDRDGFGDDTRPRPGCAGAAGFAQMGGDCDDLRPEVNPGGVEVCDMLDNDCDAMVDETVRIDGFADDDRDLYGDDNTPVTGCLDDPALAVQGGDCDDTDPTVHPTQPELCDGLDNDCDAVVDEAIEPVTWYRDADDDGFGAADGETRLSCAQVEGFALLPLDCDDSRPGINPAAPERCDGVDNDCNGSADFLIGAGDGEDDDADGYADLSCPGAGGSDCDDRSAATYPGAPEICDGLDNDCNDAVDEGAEALSWLPDADDDGYGDDGGAAVSSCQPVAGHTTRGGDCDDANPQRRPGMPDQCDDIDTDCDGSIDEDAERFAYYLDADGDDYAGGTPIIACQAPPDGRRVGPDCNDGDAGIYPGAAEQCDAVDDDCDGLVDEGVSVAGWADDDGDLHGDPDRPLVVCLGVGGVALVDDDCDDDNPSRHGGQVEVCDGVDNDCDDLIDEGVLDNAIWYNDSDADGFGDPTDPAPVESCDPQPLHSIRTGDCDDGDPDIHEGAPEVCDGVDNDCDGNSDEGLLDLVPELCNGDTDDDCDGQIDEGCECVVGHIEICGTDVGQCEQGIRACDAPGFWSECLGGVSPQPELCDGLDNDCNGVDDLAEGCNCIATDPPRSCGELAGIGECRSGLQACVNGDWGACVGNVGPAAELCDGLDNDCNGEADEGDTCRIFAVGGTVTGLGGTLELTKGAEKIVIDADGGFVFTTLHFEGDPYAVTISGQPDDQICELENGSGTVPMADVADLVVTCRTVYRVGGDASGVAGGTLQLSLSAAGGDVRGAAYLTEDGPFQFDNPIADGDDYEVSVSRAPPGQACLVENGTGLITGAQVTDVVVTCVDAPFAIGGTLTGAAGDVTLGLALVGYGTSSIMLGGDGSYAFLASVPDGAQYMVMVIAEPSSQSCSVANAMGTVGAMDVTNVDVTCIDRQPIGGSASGLSGPVGLSLNGGATLTVAGNGSFSFPQYLLEGDDYAVTFVSEPLGQTCSLSNESGTVPAGPVTDIALTCMDHPFVIGGDVTGLSGSAWLQLDGGPALRVENGSFSFPEHVPDGYDYDVTLVAQPAGHICALQAATGTVASADVGDVRLRCHPEMTYAVGGSVSGLSGMLTLQLSVAGAGPKLVVSDNGSFSFDAYYADGVNYSVAITAEPSNQRCSVSNASGTIMGADVNTVAVTCQDAAYRVGGNASGITGSLGLQLNGGDEFIVFADGYFELPDKLGDGDAYAIAISSQPPDLTCSLSNESGTIMGASVADVVVDCDGNPSIVDTFPKRGAVTGVTDQVRVTADEALDPASIAGVVLVTYAGADGAFGTADDELLTPGMTALTDAGATIELTFGQLFVPGSYYVDVGPGATDLAGSALPPDAFYFTVFGSTDIDFDGVPDSAEAALGLTVGLWDTDGDGIGDGMEDFEGDLLVNTAEFLYGTDPAIADSDGDGTTDADEDWDGDGLTAADEFMWGSDPFEPDTDADGWWDILETSRGGDPLHAGRGPVLYQVAHPPVQATIVDVTDVQQANTTVAYPPGTVTIVDVSGALAGSGNITVANPPVQVTIVDVANAALGSSNITVGSPPNIQVTVVDVTQAGLGGGNITVGNPPVQTTVVDLAAVNEGGIAIANPPVQTTIVDASDVDGVGNVILGSPPVEVEAE